MFLGRRSEKGGLAEMLPKMGVEESEEEKKRKEPTEPAMVLEARPCFVVVSLHLYLYLPTNNQLLGVRCLGFVFLFGFRA